jgi:hypothetical protein
MLPENAAPRAISQISSLIVGPCTEKIKNIDRIASKKDLAIRLKKRFDTFPYIGNDRRSAGSRLEKTNAGAVSCPDHVGSRDIEGVTAPSIEVWMFVWRHVIDTLHILRPLDLGRILRASYREAQMRRLSRRLDQEPL